MSPIPPEWSVPPRPPGQLLFFVSIRVACHSLLFNDEKSVELFIFGLSQVLVPHVFALFRSGFAVLTLYRAKIRFASASGKDRSPSHPFLSFYEQLASITTTFLSMFCLMPQHCVHSNSIKQDFPSSLPC
jgi:hypothetical protein